MTSAAQTAEVEFNHSNADIIDRVVHRARQTQPDLDTVSLTMDLMAADGVNGNDPIDFDRLIAADDSNFAHDVFGIERHMDRVTGRLMGHFRPRFTASLPTP